MHIRIIKMGGAAFTDKSKRETLHDNFTVLLSALVKALTPTREEKEDKAEKEREEGSVGTVLIHGAGSFGHHDAKYSPSLSHPSLLTPFYLLLLLLPSFSYFYL
jgi:isopentenyl phosphate kinase